MRTKFFILSVLFLIILSACGNRPRWVLSEDKMEDVLYDIHIADAEVEMDYTYFNENKDRKPELYNTVFEKHGITKEQFDTSLVWYSADMERYMKIYEKMLQRYTVEIDTLNAQVGRQHELSPYAATNLWNGISSKILTSGSITSHLFSFSVDSIPLDAGAMYELSFEILGTSDKSPVAAYVYTEYSDTILFTHETFHQNSLTHLRIPVIPEKKINEIQGSIRIPLGSSSGNTCITIYNFKVNQLKDVKF